MPESIHYPKIRFSFEHSALYPYRMFFPKGGRVTNHITDNNNNEVVDLIASYDAAWKKRGYNSFSGHASLIGFYSKKVMAYVVRDIYCRYCSQKTSKDHNCKKNHSGSSKSMESRMAVEAILDNENLTELKCRKKTLVGDDDSSVIAALRQLSPYPIIKWSDFNHTKKTFNSKLYDIKLSAALRESFSKMFCLAVKEDKNCEVKYFKDGKCLTDTSLRMKLEKIIQPFINSAPQIAPCALSQSNKSFNNTVCSKHPKSAFYGGSESHTYRVAIATLQKNMVPLKKRRLELKKERCSKNARLSNSEGITYSSGCGYLNTSDLIDQAVVANNYSFEDCAFVYFDVETTGLSDADEIVQIAASHKGKNFDAYILPRKQMNAKASELTGLTVLNGEMFYHEKRVSTLSPRDAFMSFLYFLKSLHKPCILVGHNAFKFDVKKIMKLATSLRMSKEMMMFVKGFCDTLPLFHSVLPKRKKNKGSFKQEVLTNEFLDKSDIILAHNALNDVLMLALLIQKLKINPGVLIKHTKSVEFIMNEKERRQKMKNYKESLSTLDISNAMKEKISKAGIDRSILVTACETGGMDALKILLSESINGKPRVCSRSQFT
ncbi:uncharacterized protein LOC124413719 [Diprion similis]|uniref:uncharacterized protein LOC124413719 n=1 Tax=Diprion similis TaxID=362088 RepID=UPI001EF999CF|nr:uncharacterized protein LOC124413719 [Diprion similis]